MAWESEGGGRAADTWGSPAATVRWCVERWSVERWCGEVVWRGGGSEVECGEVGVVRWG